MKDRINLNRIDESQSIIIDKLSVENIISEIFKIDKLGEIVLDEHQLKTFKMQKVNFKLEMRRGTSLFQKGQL